MSTDMRTSSEPEDASCCICCTVSATLAVFVLVMDCMTIGALLPIFTELICVCTLFLRVITSYIVALGAC